MKRTLAGPRKDKGITNAQRITSTKVTLVAVLLGLSTPTLSLSSDQFKPYYVQASEIIYRRLDHITIYKGYVYATQGTTQFSGDKVTVYSDCLTNRIARIVAVGRPAHYTTIPNTDKARLYAEANTITYYPSKAQVVLIKDARVVHNQDILTGPHIWYDIKKQTVISTNPGEKSTTTMVVEP